MEPLDRPGRRHSGPIRVKDHLATEMVILAFVAREDVFTYRDGTTRRRVYVKVEE